MYKQLFTHNESNSCRISPKRNDTAKTDRGTHSSGSQISIEEACKIALKSMPGYYLTSASETDDGWFFGFRSKDWEVPDEQPLLISKTSGKIIPYNYIDYYKEIMKAKPISLSTLKL